MTITTITTTDTASCTSTDALTLLRLMQLADSQAPIGATAHSFGLETQVDDGALTVAGLSAFLETYLAEMGRVEAAFCRRAHRIPLLVPDDRIPEWLSLNRELSAWKPAREARAASAALGRRLLQLVLSLGVDTSDAQALLAGALQAARDTTTDVHHVAAFGLIGSTLGVGEDEAALSFLQQGVTSLVSVCQRLLPLGQTGASRMLWDIKPAIIAAVDDSRTAGPDDLASFTPLLDLGGMRHTTLTTRLFIS